MDPKQEYFNEISRKLTENDPSVTFGRMMSSPGIKYKGKVFAFYYRSKMVFKLWKGFNFQDFEIESFEILSPFKNKAP
jgi:hypothetical protein